ELREVITANADTDHIELPLDAFIECSDQIAAPATRDYLENVQFSTRRKTHDALRPRAISGSDNTGAVGAMPDRVDRPTTRPVGVGELDAMGYVAQKWVGVVASGVD